MFFLLPLIGAAVGATVGAFASHAAGEKDRQAAKHHRQVANDLSTKYSNLEKLYNEYADKSKQQINDLTRQRALDEAEKDLLRLAIRLQQSLYTLMWNIDEQPTNKALVEFEKAVLTTNTVLLELKEEIIQVPDRYFSRNLERANETVAELPAEKLKGDIYPIVQCPRCDRRNRIRPHDLKFTIICGNCSAELRKAYKQKENSEEEYKHQEEMQKQSQQKNPKTQQKSDLIFNTVRDFVAGVLNVEPSEILPNSMIFGDRGVDDLDVVKLIVALEDAFNIKISDEDFVDIRTVKDAVHYIKNKTCMN